MSDVSTWTGTGRIGAVPELKNAGQSQVLKLRIAVSHYRGPNKDRETSWMNVELWGRRAEPLSRLLRKGGRVAGSGEFSLREYEKRDGGRGYSAEVRADRIEPMDPKSEGGSSSSARQSARSPSFDDFGGAGDFGDDDIPFAPLGDVW